MRKATHLAMGLLLFVIVDKLFSENPLILFLLILIGSILPDIDIVTSAIGRRAKIIGNVFKHRGFIHSIWATIISGLLVYAIGNNYVYTLAFVSSYLMHLVLDSLTKAGIKPFWIGPKIKGKFKTGGVVDKVMFVVLVVASVLLM